MHAYISAAIMVAYCFTYVHFAQRRQRYIPTVATATNPVHNGMDSTEVIH